MVNNIVKDLKPSTGDNLSGMAYDIDSYFSQEKSIKFIDYKKTNNNRCMFEIHLKATKEAKKLVDVEASLEKIYSNIRYRYLTVSSICTYQTKAILEFATVIQENSFYVTGRAEVSGKHYELLAKEWEATYEYKLPIFGRPYKYGPS